MTLDPEVFVRLRGKIPSTPTRTALTLAQLSLSSLVSIAMKTQAKVETENWQ